MNQQRGFTLLEMMLVLALVAITASVVLFTYGREDAANTRARETAARFTAALELAIDRATLSGQPVGIHFSDSAWRIMVPGKTPSAWRWVPLQEDAADESKNDWDEELSIHLQPFKPDDSNQPQVVILADGQITPFSLLMANAGTGEPLLMLVSSGSWPLDQMLARDTRP
ncbi:type II secretion system minor pseudopilin GspH [Escherichia coli]|nr:type II secretion system minor pseudopilin GspH [Escherichia coli]